MKLVSWNLWSDNKDQIKSINSLLDQQPDVLCLQEVSQKCLQYIKKVPNYDFIVARDFNETKKKTKKEFALVIMSKFPILNKDGENKFNVEHLTRRSVWDVINRWQESLEFQYADVEYNGKKHRIFNIHLEVAAGPKLRFQQLKLTLQHFNPEMENIICGDLNIYASVWVNLILGWIMGYRPNEFFTNERKLFEKEFKKAGLKNVFRGKATYPKYRLQLDHILLPESVNLRHSEVMLSVNGSDHRAIQAVI